MYNRKNNAGLEKVCLLKIKNIMLLPFCLHSASLCSSILFYISTRGFHYHKRCMCRTVHCTLSLLHIDCSGVFSMEALAMCVLPINPVLVTKSLFQQDVCMCGTGESSDSPCKTITSIPAWLFNTFTGKCIC